MTLCTKRAVLLLAIAAVLVGRPPVARAGGSSPGLAPPPQALPVPQGGDPPPFIRFDRLSISDGLSFSVVLCTLQDRQGFLWVGTVRGLNRYDGATFTKYRHNPDDPRTLAHDQVTILYEDRDGNLWVGTANGLDRLDRATGEFVHVGAGLSGQYIYALYQDREGSMWIGTNAGLNRHDRNSGEFISYPTYGLAVIAIHEDPSGRIWVGGEAGVYQLDPLAGQGSERRLIAETVTDIMVDRHGSLWAATNLGLRRLDPGAESFVTLRHDPADPDSLSDDVVTALLEDSAGRVWVGTSAGLDVFDRAQGRFVHFRYDPDDAQSLSDDLVTSLYEDRSGVLWVGTLRGLSKYSWAANRFALYTRLPDVPSATGQPVPIESLAALSDDRLLEVYADREGVLWIGTYDGGLNRLDRAAGTLTVYRFDPANRDSLSSDVVEAVYEDSSGDLWVGTERGLDRFDAQTGRFLHSWGMTPLPTEPVLTIGEDPAGNLWVGTGANLYRFDRTIGSFRPYAQLGLSVPTVTSLDAEGSGVLWVGTAGGGVARWDGTGFESFGHQADDLYTLSSDYVVSVYAGPSVDPVIWVGTDAAGLNRLDPATGQVTRYGRAEGLPGERVGCIVADEQGLLWLGTSSGISRFDPRSGSFRNFDAQDGLQSGAFLRCDRSESGEMLFAGLGGLNSFYPGLLRDNPYPPPVAITAIRLYNEPQGPPVRVDGRLELDYRQNDLSFEFAALDYHAPAKNQYAYRLQGIDGDWVYAGTRRYADYTNLPPGSYVLQVKASNNDGVWNEEGTSLYITIRPPFWQTLWFRIVAAAALLGTAALAYWRRVHGIEVRRRELELQVEQRTAELRREIEQRTRAEQALLQREKEQAVTEERNRLARELHDAVTQTLFSSSLIAEVLPRLWERSREEALTRLEELRQLNRGALAEMRTLLFELRPAALEKADMRDLLRQLADAIRGRVGLTVQVEADAGSALPPAVNVALYRIAQEALNNAVKHARPSQVTVRFRARPEVVTLEVADDGQGFDAAGLSPPPACGSDTSGSASPAAAGAGHGLRIMRERAAAIGATIQVQSQPAQGTRVLVTWGRGKGEMR